MSFDHTCFLSYSSWLKTILSVIGREGESKRVRGCSEGVYGRSGYNFLFSVSLASYCKISVKPYVISREKMQNCIRKLWKFNNFTEFLRNYFEIDD